jgi:hypothetical protein
MRYESIVADVSETGHSRKKEVDVGILSWIVLGLVAGALALVARQMASTSAVLSPLLQAHDGLRSCVGREADIEDMNAFTI